MNVICRMIMGILVKVGVMVMVGLIGVVTLKFKVIKDIKCRNHLNLSEILTMKRKRLRKNIKTSQII